MATEFRTQGIQDLLAFPFRGPGSKTKLLIAAALGVAGFIIPILPTLFLLGYGGLIMHRIIVEKGKAYMPEWQDWGRILSFGLKLGGVLLIYWLPLVVLVFGGYVAMMASMLGSAISSSSSSAEAGRALAIQFGGMFMWMCGFGLAILLGTALWLVLPAVLGHVVATDSFAAAFHFRDWWRIVRANIGGFVVTMVLLGGTYMLTLTAAQVLYMTVILCILLPFVFGIISAYLTLIASALFAHAYVEAAQRLTLPPLPSSEAAAA
jgi:hypothetical protein